mgnify:CR=1 FL=1
MKNQEHKQIIPLQHGISNMHAALYELFQVSRRLSINHFTTGKCSALWIKSGRTESVEITSNVIGCQFPSPCLTPCSSLRDSLIELIKHGDRLYQLITELGFPPFKSTEVEFIIECDDVVGPIAIAIDRLQGDKEFCMGNYFKLYLRSFD